MRTTLTLDDDVSVQLAKLRRERGVAFRDLVNDLLRRGLDELQRPPKRKKFRTPTANCGGLLIPSIDCYGEVLEYMEEQERRDTH